MPALLFHQPLAQRLHQLVEPAKRLDLRAFFLGQEFLGHFAQPFGGDFHRGFRRAGRRFQPLEDFAENTVKAIQMAFILHERSARQMVEILHIKARHAGLHGAQQRQIFRNGSRHTGSAQRNDEGREHRPRLSMQPPHQTFRRVRKARRSNKCTSCSFLSKAP